MIKNYKKKIYVIHNLWPLLGSTFGVIAGEDFSNELVLSPATDEKFSNYVNAGDDLSYDVVWDRESRANFEEAWKEFRHDPRAKGRGSADTWYLVSSDEEGDTLFLGFSREGAGDTFCPDDPLTYPGESMYATDPPIWLRVQLPFRQLREFAESYVTLFWS